MKVKELKDWINTLPVDFLEYDVVNGEEGDFDGEMRYRIDKPIVTLLVDDETKELVFLHVIQDEIG